MVESEDQATVGGDGSSLTKDQGVRMVKDKASPAHVYACLFMFFRCPETTLNTSTRIILMTFTQLVITLNRLLEWGG